MEVVLYGRKIDLGPTPSKICKQRWLGEMSPEPETVAWIETMEPKAEFFDIGASIGTHSVRAALWGLWVTAFEPHNASFLELLATMERNLLPVACVNIAISDEISQGRLVPGRSKYTFHNHPHAPGQPVASATLDYICHLRDSYPKYIKIDVDGNEVQIIHGGETTLKKAKSVLIEVDPVINSEIPHLMKSLGFHYDQKQVDACMIREGKYKGTANYIFNK
jgi:FkbM family methyltransferase